MTHALWFVVIGGLMLTRGLMPAAFARMPFTPAMLYLLVGVLLGPMAANVFALDPLQQAPMLERLTEIAVLISLFSAGVKMPVPLRLMDWRPPLRLAWVSMILTIGLVAGFVHWVLNLPWGAGILLGAILAPTDPVLATDVQSRHPGDQDRLRFLLTSEAGMNDGTAFPFVMLGLGLLGLHPLGNGGSAWLWRDVLWATVAALGLGAAGGWAAAQGVWRLRRRKRFVAPILDDLVGLGFIAVVYGACVILHAWGFMAVFVAGLSLRHVELHLARTTPAMPEQAASGDKRKVAAHADAPDELATEEVKAEAEIDASTATQTSANATSENADDPATPPTVSADSLVFKEHLERLSELMLVLLLGGMVFSAFWNWRSVALALFLMGVARPVAVLIGLAGTRSTWRVRAMAAWFGVRGIGSIYYLMYALQQGVVPTLARALIECTLVAVMLSILLHGVSVKPLLRRWWRA